MRIYHIGPPKTGTSSFQHLLKNNPIYIGITQPRGTQRQKPAYLSVTSYLRHGEKIATESLPDHFIYSEEMILWSLYPGHIHEVFERLAALLRPQDKVIIATRDLKEVLFSWYLERFEDFHPSNFRTAALEHASFEAYNWNNLTTLMSRVAKSQIEVLDFKDLLQGKSKTLANKINTANITNKNNKHKGNTVLISLKNPRAVRFLELADHAYFKAFPSKNNQLRFSRSKLIQPYVPLKTFQIQRPSEPELFEVIHSRFLNGLVYLKSEFGIDYNALQQP